jgi:hypothetical protein
VGGIRGGVQRSSQVVGQATRQVAGRCGVQLRAETQRRLLRRIAEAGRLLGTRLGQVPKGRLWRRRLQDERRAVNRQMKQR